MAGRKPLPTDKKRRPITVKLDPRTIAFLKSQTISQSRLIEAALKKCHRELK